MELNVHEILETSTLDWPGKVVMVIFLNGCPYRCGYCANHKLWKEKNMMPVKDVIARVKAAQPFIDGVVVSGGEPLMQYDPLKQLLARCRELGLKTAIETSGAYPKYLHGMLPYLDAVFVDFKAPTERYPALTGHIASTHRILDTVEILEVAKTFDHSPIFVEYRITVFEGLNNELEDIQRMSKWLKYGDSIKLQQGQPELCYDKEYKRKYKVPTGRLQKLAEVAQQYVKNVRIGDS